MNFSLRDSLDGELRSAHYIDIGCFEYFCEKCVKSNVLRVNFVHLAAEFHFFTYNKLFIEFFSDISTKKVVFACSWIWRCQWEEIIPVAIGCFYILYVMIPFCGDRKSFVVQSGYACFPANIFQVITNYRNIVRWRS